MSRFDEALAVVLENEGEFTNNPADAGNWTGGRVGSGLCRGTKWGISAAAYPSLDIQALTLDDVRKIYLQQYWNPICGDSLPDILVLLLFDAAVNLGVGRAVKLLQETVDVLTDGMLGPKTLAAVLRVDPVKMGVEFQARRLLFMLALPGWKNFGQGWIRRVIKLTFDGASMMPR